MTAWTTDDVADFVRTLATSVEESADIIEERHVAGPPAGMTSEWLAGYLHGMRTTAAGLKYSATLTAAADRLPPEAFDELAEQLG